MPTVSIVVPVYNVEDYVSQCIESLINQTLSDIQIILIDDGSNDSSPEICDRYAEKDKRVVVIHQENQGVSVARNAGLSVAAGEWVTFVDGDDWVDSHLCEVIVKKATESDADVLIYSYWTAYPDRLLKTKLIDLPSGDITAYKDLVLKKTICQLYGGNVKNNGVSAGTTWGKLIRLSSIAEKNLMFKPGLVRAQDTVFWLRGFEEARKIVLIDESLYYYRVSSNSVTSGTRYLPDSEKLFGMLIDEYESFINRYAKDSDYQVALDLRIIQILRWNIRHNYFNDKNERRTWGRVKQLSQICKLEPYKSAIRNVKIDYLRRSQKALVMCCRLKLYALYYVCYELWLRRNRAYQLGFVPNKGQRVL